MSYALRNSLILALLLVIVSSAGAYWVAVRRVERIERLVKSEKVAQTELDNINAVLAIYDTTLVQLNRLKARWQARKQIVPASDTPSKTLVYLQGLLKSADANLSYDFLFKGRRDETGYSVNRYVVAGEGGFRDLYKLIWHLEQGRRFYSIDHMEVSYQESGTRPGSSRWDWIDYTLVLRSFFEPRSRVEDLPAIGDASRPGIRIYNPFRPRITQALPSNRAGLLNISGAKLIALTPETAYISNTAGKMYTLKQGDRVYLGRIKQIDMVRNRVVFELNKGGILERRTLSVKMGGGNQ